MPVDHEAATPVPLGKQELVLQAYAELHALAKRLMAKERLGHSLWPTALANMAWEQLVGPGVLPADATAQDVLRLALPIMRHLLIDHGRARRRLKRGGGAQSEPLDAFLDRLGDPGGDAGIRRLELIDELERLDPRQAQAATLYYEGGFSQTEIASLLGISLATVEREFRSLKAFLRARLLDDRIGGEAPCL